MGMANGADRPGEAPGFRKMFEPGRLTLGVFFRIEAFDGDRQNDVRPGAPGPPGRPSGLRRPFRAVVPLRDPTFGHVGQVYDPWVYLGWIAARRSTSHSPPAQSC